jgi:glutamate/tyrosine decarboxylase-like PLP-dependent enzyme
MDAKLHPGTTATPLAPRAGDRRDAPLRMAPDEFRRIGHALVDQVAEFLATLPERPVTPGESPEALRTLLPADAPLPDEGRDAGELLRSAAALLFDHSLFNGHPRFFGYITSSPAPIGMLGDFLAAAVNANVGSWRLAPIATEIEAQTVRWVAQLVGFPADGGGLLVSGGNMANSVGLFAARAAAAEWDVRVAGVAAPATRPLRVYASAETHTWIQKAADLAGIGTGSIRWIATDDRLRMDTRALRAAIAHDRDAGDRPMLVVGTGGSVSTGAVDPLAEIAGICREENVWFHVDGAYGALAAAVPGVPADLAALGLADSVAVDPHKWLYAPLEAGCTLVRDPRCLRDAFSYHPPYYHFGVEATNYVDLGPQNSRGFRALKVWLALQQVGRSGYLRMIGDDIRLSKRLHAAVGDQPELEAITQELSISTFRYVPADLRSHVGTEAGEAYLNALNQALLERVQSSGEAFVSNAVIGGRYVLRACIVNFNTAPADVEALPQIVVRLGREVDAALRPERPPPPRVADRSTG